MKKGRVVVGLSGGVDSSVAAYLLREQGYEVIGIFMRNWHDDSVTVNNECPWIEDSNDAMLVAQKLGIPFQVLDLSEDYRKRIVEYMFAEYEAGRTPNPDVLCNREIKFDIFLKAALALDAEFVATGHYCRKTVSEGPSGPVYHLLAGADENKDQSYFLCQLNQEQLAKALFPIGDLVKSEVRRIAAEQDLVTAGKKDSQGLCFIGKVRLPEFLQQKLKSKKGLVYEIPADHSSFSTRIELPESSSLEQDWVQAQAERVELSADMGQLRGEHNGAHFYTTGQRKGLGIGGSPEPLFIIGTNVEKNEIYVGQGEDHPGLLRKGLRIKAGDIHWIREDLALKPGESCEYQARIRYRQPLEKAVLHQFAGDLFVVFDNPQKAIAAGQFVAWYQGAELIGSGVISA